MDQDLVVRAQHGDRRAFEAIATADYPRLYRLALGVLRERGSAEDACQDALVRVWRSIPKLRDPARFEAWSYRLLMNACHDQARHGSRWLPEVVLTADVEPTAADAYRPVDERDRLEHALSRLSVEHRAVLAFRYLVELTPDEIAASMGIPRKTVYSRLTRATEAMRAALEAEDRLAIEATQAQGAAR